MNIPLITFSVARENILPFTTLLQYGISFKLSSETNLIDFLQNQLRVEYQFLQENVETILLDGLPIDSLHCALNKKEHTIALSAAMPGLAGAILRRNSIHAGLRTKPAPKKEDLPQKESVVRVKLFNTIAQKLGPAVLLRGVEIANRSFLSFFSIRPHLQSKIEEIWYDGAKVSYGHCLQMAGNSPQLSLLFRGYNE